MHEHKWYIDSEKDSTGKEVEMQFCACGEKQQYKQLLQHPTPKEEKKCCNDCFDEGVSQLSYGGCLKAVCECHMEQKEREAFVNEFGFIKKEMSSGRKINQDVIADYWLSRIQALRLEWEKESADLMGEEKQRGIEIGREEERQAVKKALFYSTGECEPWATEKEVEHQQTWADGWNAARKAVLDIIT